MNIIKLQNYSRKPQPRMIERHDSKAITLLLLKENKTKSQKCVIHL